MSLCILLYRFFSMFCTVQGTAECVGQTPGQLAVHKNSCKSNPQAASPFPFHDTALGKVSCTSKTMS